MDKAYIHFKNFVSLLHFELHVATGTVILRARFLLFMLQVLCQPFCQMAILPAVYMCISKQSCQLGMNMVSDDL